jgi:acyl carrier protein
MSERNPTNLMNELIKWLAPKLSKAENAISPTSNLIDDLGSTASKNKEVVIEFGTRMAVSISDSEAGTIETVRDIFDMVDVKTKTESGNRREVLS